MIRTCKFQSDLSTMGLYDCMRGKPIVCVEKGCKHKKEVREP